MSIRATVAVPGTVGILPMVPAPSSDAWIVVYNATWYPLWIQFGPPVPVKPAAIGNEPDWAYQIGAGDVQKMPAPSGWDGSIYLSPFLPNGALASGLTQYATVSTYPRGQDPEIASSQPVTLLPQQRVVTVPVVPHNNAVGSGLLAGTGPATNGTLVILNPTYLAYTGQAVTIYVYWADFLLTGIRSAVFIFNVATFNGSSVLIQAYNLFTVLLAGGTPKPWYPAQPVAVQVPATPSATTLRFTFSDGLLTPSGGVGHYNVNPAWDIDPTGQPPPPSIGNGAATAPGTMY